MTTFISVFSMHSFIIFLLRKHFFFDKEMKELALSEFNKIRSREDFSNFCFWAEVNDELEGFSFFLNSLLITITVMVWTFIITACIGMDIYFQLLICLMAILIANQMYSSYIVNCQINFDRCVLKMAKTKLAYELRKDEIHE